MDLHLFYELFNNVHIDIKDVWSLFGSSNVLDSVIAYGLQDMRLCENDRWKYWPATDKPSEKAVLDWFETVIQPLLRRYAQLLGRPVYGYLPSGTLIIQDGDCQRKTDVVVSTTLDYTAPNSLKEPSRVSWHNVRVVGELKSNQDQASLDKTIIQLSNYVREVFGAQPGRRWVHGFTLCGCYMRVWLFDRAGATGSTSINIHQQPRLFLKVICGYAGMDAAEVGFEETIKWQLDEQEMVFDPTVHFTTKDPPLPYIYISKLENRVKFMLDPNPISRRYAIATRGSVCWRAAIENGHNIGPWEYVVKDQWLAAERDAEGVYLSKIPDGTSGLPTYFWHGDITTSTGDLVDIEKFIRRRFSYNSSKSEPIPEISKVTQTSKFLAKSGTINNRVLTRLITSPVGLPLSGFETYTQLLCTLRDAIQGSYPHHFPAYTHDPNLVGHRYMHNTLLTLHRDISYNNILLHPSGVSGFLIDFDLAIYTSRQTNSGSSHRTGTYDFMAAGILLGRSPHTALHDLESFFYVFLWMCVYFTPSLGRRFPKPKVPIFPTIRADEESTVAHGTSKIGCMNDLGFLPIWNSLTMDTKEKLGNTLQDWRKIISSLHTVVDMNLVSTVEEDGNVERKYEEVLALLQKGIRELNGR